MNAVPALKMPVLVTRGVVHIIVGLAIGVLAFILSRTVMLTLMGIATGGLLIFDVSRLKISRLNDWFQAVFKPFLRGYESTRLLGASYMFIASLVSLIVFKQAVAALAISFLALGDALATMVGERIGRVRLFKKNLEGVLACLAGCLVLGFIWHYLNTDPPLLVIIAGAFGAAVAESLPLPIDDNLIIPLFAGTIMSVLLWLL